MNKILYILIGLIIAGPSYAANSGPQHSRSMIGGVGNVIPSNGSIKPSIRFQDDEAAPVHAVTPVTPATPVDNTDERTACLANNIGARNTFVWASKDSNTDNYSTMQEDTQNPENNVCFARVELFSGDTNVNISDIPGKYFQTDTLVNCGEWVDQEILEKRILDAKKSARTWATVAGSVGGAGVGVGAMELFGNKLIGGAVMGQKNKNLSDDDLLVEQLKSMKGTDKYNVIVKHLKEIKQQCTSKTNVPRCTTIKYDEMLKQLDE